MCGNGGLAVEKCARQSPDPLLARGRHGPKLGDCALASAISPPLRHAGGGAVVAARHLALRQNLRKRRSDGRKVDPVPAVRTNRSKSFPAVRTNGPFVDLAGVFAGRKVDPVPARSTFGSRLAKAPLPRTAHSRGRCCTYTALGATLESRKGPASSAF